MKILITGANGMLAKEIKEKFAQGNELILTDVAELDITNQEMVMKFVEKEKPECIINCAAFTAVDKAEVAGEIVEKINADGPGNLAKAAKANNATLVHVSTDYVFGGDPYNTPCKEDQKGTPTGVYGLTKMHGEQKIQVTGINYLIFRTAWLYSEFGKNFVKTMLSLTATKPQLKVVFDQVGTPTYAYDLAKAIFDIIGNRKFEGNTGIYHYSNEGVCSWFDFTKMIAEYSDQKSCDIQPCHSDEFPSPVQRPSYSVLDKSKVKEAFGIRVPYWTESLKQCIQNIKG